MDANAATARAIPDANRPDDAPVAITVSVVGARGGSTDHDLPGPLAAALIADLARALTVAYRDANGHLADDLADLRDRADRLVDGRTWARNPDR